MDLVPGGFTMSHALGKPKPWAKKFLVDALNGRGVSMADKNFWKHAKSPIKLYSDHHIRARIFELKMASGIGRFIRRG
jgi:hypothetical protein